MAVSLDTYDKEKGIHPRNKQLPSKRFATAGLNVAYGRKEFPTRGPFPANWTFNLMDDNAISVRIDYDSGFVWSPIESEGFYVCCNQDTFEMCKSQGKSSEHF